MRTNIFAKKLLAMVAMTFMFAMYAGAQKRLMEFQEVMSMNETTYKNFIKEGNYRDAITPLTKLINILDTTTIHKDTDIPERLIKESKGMYQYDLACCYALIGQKTKVRTYRQQALQAYRSARDAFRMPLKGLIKAYRARKLLCPCSFL